jgi:hypothetical protein
MKNLLFEKKKVIFGIKKNTDYAACLKNAVNFLVGLIHKMNFYGWFFYEHSHMRPLVN